MYDPYEDYTLLEGVENASRENLEVMLMELVQKYVNTKTKLEELQHKVSWEQTARQQERSGGWM